MWASYLSERGARPFEEEEKEEEKCVGASRFTYSLFSGVSRGVLRVLEHHPGLDSAVRCSATRATILPSYHFESVLFSQVEDVYSRL